MRLIKNNELFKINKVDEEISNAMKRRINMIDKDIVKKQSESLILADIDRNFDWFSGFEKSWNEFLEITELEFKYFHIIEEQYNKHKFYYKQEMDIRL